MDEEERENFLRAFEMGREKSLIGFGVLGGIFSEGIDLIGNRLIGAAVIGTGLPQVSCEREILKEYYDAKGEQGFDYAYRYPGMNKVLQAAGRVIRTRKDRGTILLMDERFTGRDYRMLFPREWNDSSLELSGKWKKRNKLVERRCRESDKICLLDRKKISGILCSITIEKKMQKRLKIL